MTRVRARIRRLPIGVSGRTVYVRVASLLGTARLRTRRVAFGMGLAMSIPFWVTLSPDDHRMEDEAMEDRTPFDIDVKGADRIGNALTTAASGAGAVGPVTTVGDRTVIPLIETVFTGGFGGGGGTGEQEGQGAGVGGGGGGGGFGRSRTVAVAIVGPDGVTIRPVFDATGVTLTALTAGLGLVARAVVRRRRR
jgi:uncharacterized spore protein YtfJ